MAFNRITVFFRLIFSFDMFQNKLNLITLVKRPFSSHAWFWRYYQMKLPLLLPTVNLKQTWVTSFPKIDKIFSFIVEFIILTLKKVGGQLKCWLWEGRKTIITFT